MRKSLTAICAASIVLFISNSLSGQSPREPAAKARSEERFILTERKPPLSGISLGWKAIFTPDSRMLVVESGVWDCKTGKLVCRINNPGGLRCAVSPDSKRVASITEGYSSPKNLDGWYGVAIAEIENGKHIHTFRVPDSSIPGGSAGFNKDGTRIFVYAYDRLFVLNSDTGKIEETYNYGWRCSCVSPEGITIIQAIPYFPPEAGEAKPSQLQFKMQMRELVSGKIIWTSPPMQGNVEHAAFTSDGKYVFASAKSANVQGALISFLWDSATGKQINIENTRGEFAYHISSEMLFGKRYLVMMDDKCEHSIMLDLTTRKLVPVQVKESGKSLIMGVAPDGITCFVRRYIPGGKPSLIISFAELKLQH